MTPTQQKLLSHLADKEATNPLFRKDSTGTFFGFWILYWEVYGAPSKAYVKPPVMRLTEEELGKIQKDLDGLIEAGLIEDLGCGGSVALQTTPLLRYRA